MEYYSTEEGKFKKNIQNGKRGKGEPKANLGKRVGESMQDVARDMCRLDAGMVCYVRMVTSLIEGRRVSRNEILQMLARAVRQHSMARRRRIDYVLWLLRDKAP